MNAGGPAFELLVALVRDAAGARRCAACGTSLQAATAEPEAVEPERVVARLVCRCGATETVEIRPVEASGRAEIA